jgi:hypothetical protein
MPSLQVEDIIYFFLRAKKYACNNVLINLQVVDLAAQLFNFKEKFNNSTSDSFLPPNTVMGNDPILIPTDRVTIEAVR